MLGCNPQDRSGLKLCSNFGDVALPVLAPTSSHNGVTHRAHLPKPLPQVRLCSSNHYGKSTNWHFDKETYRLYTLRAGMYTSLKPNIVMTHNQSNN